MSTQEPLPRAYEPAQVEAKWFPKWEAAGNFHGKPNPEKKPYSIVIPPPNVTGILTLGHVLNNTLQDILCRYHRMKGEEVCWFPGTDHAGIATEARVEKYLRKEENTGRDELGREEFIRRVWQWKGEFGGKIIRQLRTLGCSCDWERERFTMDEGLSEAVRKVFVELYHKGYIYRGQRMINWCPVAKSALSDEEVIYKEVPGKFYHFRYPLADGSGYLVVATTRPETMFGDTAVAVHPDDERYKHLIGKMVRLPLTDREIPIIADEHADPTKGTGCVKITPAHDPNDFEVGRRHGLEVINIMNPDASLNARCGAQFEGLDRFEARDLCVKLLEEQGLVEKIEDIRHAVGYSERGDVPIETLVSYQWFCNMKELAKPAIEAVKSGKIKFYPERWSKTYFHWMENIQDWCISRQIWWGHRIPAWYNDENGEIYVGMEAPTAPGKWRQEEDVLDTWFSSWLWPFSIMGWPKETEELKYFYPTCDLVTGPDIIFFWVARMIMAGCEFMKEIPFRNVYFTSIIRDEQGRKLSKSLGNSPDPLDVIAEYGADALRFSIVYIAPVGMDIRYSNEKCELGRNFANKLWNACRFRQMQGGVSAGFRELDPAVLASLSCDERWMLSRLDAAISSITTALAEFRFHSAAHELYDLVWSNFCDWFIEAEKVPMRAGGAEKERALAVLDYALFRILRLLHPFMPFITEELAHQMGFVADGASIMYESFPETDACCSADPAELERVDGKFELVRGGRFLKASYNIPDGKKVKFYVKAVDADALAFFREQEPSLRSLLNAEEIEFSLDDFDSAARGAAPSRLCRFGTIYLPLADLIDVAAERKKLEKQQKELQGWIAGSRAKLSNERFLAKAPEQVVADARAHLAELEEKLARTEEMLNSLR
ncbi:valine--tRNA ligase [uncultured Victivallis sp.]|uniref:valine--tRNA ligase n=1 Tax=uncultured Victivallis sp. TaxID=354118 RepID=UPI0025F17B9A|nr:valine--tRNA ligase [uncultured Victivallis sp.]